MHVFLTGPVQIGKSTLIAAALDAIEPEQLGGFRTVSAKPEADGSRPVYLHPAAAQDLFCNAHNRVGIRRPALGIASFLDAFETAGLAALADAEDCDLILMDEIGPHGAPCGCVFRAHPDASGRGGPDSRGRAEKG